MRKGTKVYNICLAAHTILGMSFIKTTKKRPIGLKKPRFRMTTGRKSYSATAIIWAEVSPKTAKLRHIGISKLQTMVISMHNICWVFATITARVSEKVATWHIDDLQKLPQKATLLPNAKLGIITS